MADGQPALGITDHGNMYGVLDFYAACRQGGHQPGHRHRGLHGRRVAPRAAGPAGQGRRHRGRRRRGREALLPPDPAGRDRPQGYRNLLKLSSAAYLEGYYYKPRLDWELLERHHEGLIATTGCLGGVVLQALLADDQVKAETLAGRLQDIFGRDNLFVELQDHGLAEQHKTNPALVEIARRIGAPLLATNDSHYTHREDHVAHDALLCVQTGALIDDPKRFKFEGEEHYLKSAAEMRHLFAELPEACDNTLLIAERANVEIEFGRPSLPQFPVPDEFAGETYEERAAAYLRHLSVEGAKERYGHPDPRRGHRAARLRARRHRRHGLLRLLPGGVGPHPLRPVAAASGWARAGARPPDAAWPTASRSSTSTPSATTSSSSGSSTRAASRCPTSTWTSTSATAAT